MTTTPIFAGDLLGAGALTLLAYAFGRRLLARVNFSSPIEALSISIALGLGLISHLVFAIGLVGALHRSVVSLILAGGFIACHRVWLAWPRSVAAVFRAPCRSNDKAFRLAVLMVGLGISLPIVALTLYPPTAWDATSFHLAVAKAYVESHRVQPQPFLRYPVFPQLNNMLFVLMLMFFGDIAAQLVQCLAMFVSAGLVFAWASGIASRVAGLWAVAIWLGNPLVVLFGTVAFIDSGLTLFVLAAAYSFFKWTSTDRGEWLVLSGVFCGFAAATKYSALFFVAALGIGALYHGFRARRWSPPVVFGLAAGLMGAPWYGYNALHAGNPVFPFFGELFGYEFWDAADLRLQLHEMARHGMGKSPVALLALPWNLLFHPDAFDPETRLSVFNFLFLPALLWVGATRRQLRGMLILCLAYVLFWFGSVQVARYLMPVLPLLSLLAAAALDWALTRLPLRLGRTTAAGLVLLTSGILVFPGWSFAVNLVLKRGPPPMTLTERHEYLSRALPSYPAYRLLNERNRSRYRVYALFDENMAYFADGTFMGDWFGPARYSRVTGRIGNSRELYRELRRLGADYFLVRTARYGLRVRLQDDAFFRGHFKLLYAQGPVVLFELVD